MLNRDNNELITDQSWAGIVLGVSWSKTEKTEIIHCNKKGNQTSQRKKWTKLVELPARAGFQRINDIRLLRTTAGNRLFFFFRGGMVK